MYHVIMIPMLKHGSSHYGLYNGIIKSTSIQFLRVFGTSICCVKKDCENGGEKMALCEFTASSNQSPFLLLFWSYGGSDAFYARAGQESRHQRHSCWACLHRASILDSLKNGANAELQFTLCENNSSTSLEGKIAYVIPANASTVKLNDTMWLEFNPKSNFTCECVKNGTSIMKSFSINSCLQRQDDFSVYKTYQFWLFTLAAVISGTGAATVFCLSDAACYEVLVTEMICMEDSECLLPSVGDAPHY
ncbi:major facilitator superfamily domain-containing protein 6 [Caerostris darwini]|uniref:Major facilitator superfamily domain-containing protein 6 n=1 Tax=Caerostris darwini TaxID=1538125 RepID=A0AAV4UXC4_9ARAC|nr:major facilitator superfamily domain-containing protein 6 [Caerostris darwini]